MKAPCVVGVPSILNLIRAGGALCMFPGAYATGGGISTALCLILEVSIQSISRLVTQPPEPKQVPHLRATVNDCGLNEGFDYSRSDSTVRTM